MLEVLHNVPSFQLCAIPFLFQVQGTSGRSSSSLSGSKVALGVLSIVIHYYTLGKRIVTVLISVVSLVIYYPSPLISEVLTQHT